jgi:hypothetical protein
MIGRTLLHRSIMAKLPAEKNNKTNRKRSGWSTARRPPMAFEALVLSRYLPAQPQTADPAAPKQRGLFRTLVLALMISRRRAADRELARWRELRGGEADPFGGRAGR